MGVLLRSAGSAFMGLEGDAEGMAGGRGGLGERGMSTGRKKCLEGKM